MLPLRVRQTASYLSEVKPNHLIIKHLCLNILAKEPGEARVFSEQHTDRFVLLKRQHDSPLIRPQLDQASLPPGVWSRPDVGHVLLDLIDIRLVSVNLDLRLLDV